MIVCIERVPLRCIYGMRNAFFFKKKRRVEMILLGKMFRDIIFEMLKKLARNR